MLSKPSRVHVEKSAFGIAFPPFFHCVQQDVLRPALGGEPVQHQLVHSVPSNYPVDKHRSVVARLHLPGGPDPLDDLQVLLKVPVGREEHQYVAAVLQVQAVAGAGRVGKQDWYLPGVPFRYGARGLVQMPPLREGLQEPR